MPDFSKDVNVKVSRISAAILVQLLDKADKQNREEASRQEGAPFINPDLVTQVCHDVISQIAKQTQEG